MTPEGSTLAGTMPRAPDGDVDVCLVNMPYSPITRPSLALGVLKACLRGTGISCSVEYANLRFADLIGMDAVRVIANSRNEDLIGEWTFSNAAFPHHRTDVEETIGLAVLDHLRKDRPDKWEHLKPILDVWRGVRDLTPAFVDETARRVLARHPRIVGCTSTFEQNTASLALLRRVKELDPTVVTMMGGANCESEMGVVVVQEFPWVDFAVSGEADEIFAPLCRLAMKRGAAIDPVMLPHGVLCAKNARPGAYGPGRASPPRAVVEKMDASPVPDFDEYFDTLEGLAVRHYIFPALPVETSRGCWWGEKSHCTFCGLNGEGMRFRAKSPERVLSEFHELATRYSLPHFQVADNILDMHHMRTVIPALAEAGAPYELFYEIKANLRRDQVALLAKSGVTKVQPGIESLHDELLKLMAKGSTAAINIELLKHAREVGINSVWLMLVAFPGEEDGWHDEVAAFVPLLHHLHPPSDVVHVRFDRFSVYHRDPDRHGLRLEPFPAYSVVYPSSPEQLANLAYFFRDANRRDARDTPGISALRKVVWAWNNAFRRSPRPVLCSEDTGDAIEIFDTRSVALARTSMLTGLEAEAYRGCEPAVTRQLLRKRLSEKATVTEAQAEEAIDSLIAKRLVLEFHGKLIGLCIPGDVPPVPEDQAGWAAGYEYSFTAAVRLARERLSAIAEQRKGEAAAGKVAPGQEAVTACP